MAGGEIHMYIYIYIYVCMYVCMYVCTYVCIHVCTNLLGPSGAGVHAWGGIAGHCRRSNLQLPCHETLNIESQIIIRVPTIQTLHYTI